MTHPKICFLTKLKPTDVKIFIEDGIPYLDYTGTCQSNIGKLEVHFPKIGLDIEQMDRESDDYYYENPFTNKPSMRIRMKDEYYVMNNQEWPFEYKVLERDMTKAEIEKELGYKINIKK